MATLSQAQSVFDKDTMNNPNVDHTEFDYSETSYFKNNNTNPADTVFLWTVLDQDIPSEWVLTVCYGTEACIPDPQGTYIFYLGIGKTIAFKLGFTLEETTGAGIASIIAFSQMNSEIKDTLTHNIYARNLASTSSVIQESFKIYPNPVKDIVTVNLINGGNEVAKIYDILGNLVFTEKFNSGDGIDIGELAKGVYIIRLEGDKTFSRLLHKQ